MRIYISRANESWIVDRFREEWYEHNQSTSVNKISKSEIVWIIAPWSFKKTYIPKIKNKKVICTIHHIDESTYSKKDEINFKILDRYVDVYHTISKNVIIKRFKSDKTNFFVKKFSFI